LSKVYGAISIEAKLNNASIKIKDTVYTVNLADSFSVDQVWPSLFDFCVKRATAQETLDIKICAQLGKILCFDANGVHVGNSLAEAYLSKKESSLVDCIREEENRRKKAEERLRIEAETRGERLKLEAEARAARKVIEDAEREKREAEEYQRYLEYESVMVQIRKFDTDKWIKDIKIFLETSQAPLTNSELRHLWLKSQGDMTHEFNSKFKSSFTESLGRGVFEQNWKRVKPGLYTAATRKVDYNSIKPRKQPETPPPSQYAY
jgi:hypothetical protein